MCEGQGKALFDNFSDCRNQITTILETTVDEFLKGSRIVDEGEDKDRRVYYAVAVLPKSVLGKIQENTQKHLEGLTR